MNEKVTHCVVCNEPIPTGYRGRPRKVCGDACYNIRRNIRGKNRTAISKAEKHLLSAVRHLVAWPDLQIETISLYSQVRGTPDEVTDANIGDRNAPGELDEDARVIN